MMLKIDPKYTALFHKYTETAVQRLFFSFGAGAAAFGLLGVFHPFFFFIASGMIFLGAICVAVNWVDNGRIT